MSTLYDKEGTQAEADPCKMMKEEIQRKNVKRTKSWPLHRDHASARVIDKKSCLWAFIVKSVLCYSTSVWRAWECPRSIIANSIAFGHSPGAGGDLGSLHPVFLTFLIPQTFSTFCCWLLIVSIQVSKFQPNCLVIMKCRHISVIELFHPQSSLHLFFPYKWSKFLVLLPSIFRSSAEIVPCLSLGLDDKKILFHRFRYSKEISKRQRWSFAWLISADEHM